MFWSKLFSWCKERWELLTGFLVGVLAIAVAIRSGGAKDIIKHKSKMQDKVDGAKDDATEKLQSSFDDNIQQFLDKDSEIDTELKNQLKDLDDEKKERVSELVKSASPEEDIANALKEILK
tara:strand:+ start:8467 stop:8829 length:363 start_codon:yes stop_codon:yes gene_type:complete